MHRLLATLVVLTAIVATAPVDAAAQHFGRNKVQYRSFDFKIIKTQHFDVYFYEEEREAALDAARMVERAYARLTRILQHRFKERKPIILYASHSEFQQTNATRGFVGEGTGAFVEPLKERMVIPLTGSYAQFERVLIHELVHQFQFDIMLRGGAMGAASSGGRRLPLWFMEGMAEYLALGHIDALTSAWLRDATLSGYLRSIDVMNRRDDYLSYRFGQALWTYIGSTWGDEVIGILLQKAPRVGLERAFRTTLGLSLQELSREWMGTVRETYLPQVADLRRADAYGEPVLHHDELQDPSYIGPALSPDGKTLALFTTRDGFFPDLWLADAETGEFKRKLVASSREADFESLRYQNSSAAFSPDGRYLAFTAQTGGRDALYIYDLDEDEIWKKFEFKLNGAMTPSWSPDGEMIVFTGLDGGVSDLFIVEVKSGKLRRLTNDRHADLFPSWSPDGKAIAFSTDRGAGTDFDDLTFSNLRVALFRLSDGAIEVLPYQEKGKNLNPVWSPDSRSLAWVSDRTGVKNLYLFDRDEAQLYRITEFLSGVMGPTATDLSPVLSWARDDPRLVFVYFESAGHSLYAVDDPRTLARVPVTELPAEEAPTPVASADGPLADAEQDSATAGAGVELGDVITSYYRSGDEFRPSAVAPEAAENDAPISVAALLDSADVGLPDTTSFSIEDYDVAFSPDIIGRPTIGAQAGGYYGNGFYGGSFIALSDMLGNHNIMLAGNINGSFSDAMFYGGYNFLKTRANYGAAVQQVPLYRYYGRSRLQLENGDLAVADMFYRDVIRSAQAMMSYPFSTFRRFELGGTATFFKRDLILRGANLTRNEALDRTERIGDMYFFQPSAALVFDNTLFGWTGPVYGRRYRLQISRTFGDFGFTEGMVDFRNYFNYKRRVVFAARLLSIVRTGGNSEAFGLYWGGPYFLRGYKADSFTRQECELYGAPGDHNLTACPLRRQLVGASSAVMNLEVRFPVITELQIGFLGNFPPVDAVVFFDGGMVWDDEICLQRSQEDPWGCAPGGARDVELVWDRKPGESPIFVREPLFSTGVGLRINVFYTVLRLDYAIPLSRPDRSGVFSISFGPSF